MRTHEKNPRASTRDEFDRSMRMPKLQYNENHIKINHKSEDTIKVGDKIFKLGKEDKCPECNNPLDYKTYCDRCGYIEQNAEFKIVDEIGK